MNESGADIPSKECRARYSTLNELDSLPASEFDFGDESGCPKSLRIGGTAYTVEASARTTGGKNWAGRNFRGKYINPDCQLLADELTGRYNPAESIYRTAETEIALASDKPPGADPNVQELNKARAVWQKSKKEAGRLSRQTVDRWIDQVKKRGFEVIEHQIKAPDLNINFRRLILGQIEPDQNSWLVDAALAERMLFASQTLGLNIPDNILIMSLSVLDAEDPLWGYPLTDMEKLLECGGFVSLNVNMAVLMGTGRKEVKILPPNKAVEITAELSTENESMAAAHELGHLLDPAFFYGSQPQTEGFAVCMEMNFNSDIIKQVLRRDYDYGRTVTRNQIIDLLSFNCPDEMPVVETYYLSASFFSFVYEQLGADKFMQFYYLLTGCRDAVWSDREKKYLVKPHLDQRNDKKSYLCRGDIIRALGVVQQEKEGWQGGDTGINTFIQSYLDYINEGL